MPYSVIVTPVGADGNAAGRAVATEAETLADLRNAVGAGADSVVELVPADQKGTIADVLSSHGHQQDGVSVYAVYRDVTFILWLWDIAFVLGTVGANFGILSDTSPLSGHSELHVGCHQLSMLVLDGKLAGSILVYPLVMFLTQDKRGVTMFDCLLQGLEHFNAFAKLLLEWGRIGAEDLYTVARIAGRHSDRGSELAGGKTKGMHGRIEALKGDSILLCDEMEHLIYNGDKRWAKAWWPQGNREFRDPAWQASLLAHQEVHGNPAFRMWATGILGSALRFDERVNYSRFTTLLMAAEVLMRDVPGNPVRFAEQLKRWLEVQEELTTSQDELLNALCDELVAAKQY
eukprot:gene146-7621_t